MNILKWLEEIGGIAVTVTMRTPPPPCFTARGNAIEPEWHSQWSPDERGIYETRRVVGQSAEGFHAGVEISYRVYERIVWGDAHPTPEKARIASAEMERARREEFVESDRVPKAAR